MDATHSPSAAPRSNSIWLWIALAVVAAGVFGYVLESSLSPAPSGSEGSAIGRHLPYLKLEGLTGDAQNVSLDDLQGHVTLLNFWGTWCPPCLREFPHIVEIAEIFRNQADFRLLAVSCGQGNDEDLKHLRRETEIFLEVTKAALPTYADEKGATRQAMTAALGLDGFAYPTTLVLDRQGTIRGFWVGYAPGSERAMRALIQELLDEPAAQPAA
jgi:thiol-disulfide isomerase/thioredoxin